MRDGAIRSSDVVVLGGGIAGLSLASVLAARGVRVRLLERDKAWAQRSSGTNAAIWLPVDDDATTAELARLGEVAWDALTEGRWIERIPAWVTARSEDALRRLIQPATAAGLRPQLVTREVLRAGCEVLRDTQVGAALRVEAAGLLDIHRMAQSAAAAARRQGAVIECDAEVVKLERRGERVSAVHLRDGRRIAAEVVVVATGAWAGRIPEVPCPLPLAPLRRHLVQLVTPAREAGEAIVWDVDDEVYVRPESGGWLASPCDETRCDPDALVIDREAATSSLTAKLSKLSPRLCDAAPSRIWACARTFAPDRELVLGACPQMRGLYWFCGLGGRGMTVAMGAALVLADLLAGDGRAIAAPMDPGRHLA